MSRLVQTYLLDAITAEKALAEHLLAFSREGDDEEVQLTFAEHASETRTQIERLERRLAAFGPLESPSADLAEAFINLAPRTPLVQDLIGAFAIETGECAMYEALAMVAQAAGDAETEALAREIKAEEVRAAEKIFRFLPSRSKIAFNVLTAGELDPSVETKVGMI